MNEKNSIKLNTARGRNKPNTVVNKNVTCPFCTDTKPLIIQDKLMLEDRGKMFWIENKFPLLEEAYQTLIVETDKCGESFATYSLEYAKELFSFIFECRDKMLETKGFKEVILFKNHGHYSDSSISHSHSQLVGLKENTYDYKEIEDSMTGPLVYKDNNVRVTVSKVPRAEFFEFNVIWKRQNQTQDYVKWVQTLIQYLSVFKKGRFTSYNLVFHETDEECMIKVIPRKPNSVYYIGFGIRQTPRDTEQIANEIKKFSGLSV
ncbi:DUF4931 domain-containing protein [Priestia filamentosa]|uniref:DUF4931 domain-containing protein n=1 Tax=Priestia filamentosa TaxID=1402861 RepID=UPI00397D5650